LFYKGVLWEAYTKEVKLTGFSITGTANLTGKPPGAKKRPMPSVF
jgi:hypothetical protein